MSTGGEWEVRSRRRWFWLQRLCWPCSRKSRGFCRPKEINTLVVQLWAGPTSQAQWTATHVHSYNLCPLGGDNPQCDNQIGGRGLEEDLFPFSVLPLKKKILKKIKAYTQPKNPYTVCKCVINRIWLVSVPCSWEVSSKPLEGQKCLCSIWQAPRATLERPIVWLEGWGFGPLDISLGKKEDWTEFNGMANDSINHVSVMKPQ